jgi:hypothetical protein
LISALSSSRKIKAPASSGAFFVVQARNGLRYAGDSVAPVLWLWGESGLRWAGNRCNMEPF